MGLNRQQRRAMAKRNQLRREIEDQYIKEVNNYKNELNSAVFEQFFVAAGLALNELYGWRQKGIAKVWNKMFAIVQGYGNDESKFLLKRQELIDKAQVEINWRNGELR